MTNVNTSLLHDVMADSLRSILADLDAELVTVEELRDHITRRAESHERMAKVRREEETRLLVIEEQALPF